MTTGDRHMDLDVADSLVVLNDSCFLVKKLCLNERITKTNIYKKEELTLDMSMVALRFARRLESVKKFMFVFSVCRNNAFRSSKRRWMNIALCLVNSIEF